MCTMVHTSRSVPVADRLDQFADDCDVALVHPRQVAAARGRLAAGPPVERVSALFGVLGDPTRTRLLTALAAGELCVCDLAAATGINRTTVSHQLRVLREGRLVRRRRDGKIVYYALADDHVATLLAMGAAHAAEEAGSENGSTWSTVVPPVETTGRTSGIGEAEGRRRRRPA